MTNQTPILPVILSGGSGTRLWPMSRSSRPKQFVSIDEKGSFFQQTLARIDASADHGLTLEKPLIVGNQQHVLAMQSQAREQGSDIGAIIAEPARRDSAPAIALAAYWALQHYDDPQILVLTSDHIILNPEELWAATQKATLAAQAGYHVTYGIKPTRPETGFGYIEIGQELAIAQGVQEAKKFREKPDEQTAKTFLQSGQHLWNSGMFLFDAQSLITDLEKFEPEVTRSCKAAMAEAKISQQGKMTDLVLVDKARFLSSPSISIDYALMERANKVAVVPTPLDWHDVGGWSALYDLTDKDQAGNSVRGDVFTMSTKNSLLWSDGPVIACIGLEDFIVVANEDVIMVAPKSEHQSIKKLVGELEKADRKEVDYHVERFRSWGRWQVLTQGKGYELRSVKLDVGGKIGPQIHMHRTETWTVIKGTMSIKVEGKVHHVSENQSFSINKGQAHSISNLGKIPIEAVELIAGDYIEADDVIAN